jgi:hypothetical protein
MDALNFAENILNFRKGNIVLGLYIAEGVLMSRKCNAVVGLHFILLHFAEGILISPKHNIIFCRKCTNFSRNVIEYTVYIYYYV